VLDPWLGVPRRLLKKGRVNLVYRFDSEDAPPLELRLKVEINTREHFTELGVVRIPFQVDNPWFTGAAGVTTCVLDELLCTKLRALYQRKKGRDLFDLWHALDLGRLDPKVLLACFQRYLAEEGRPVTRAQFEENLAGKRTDPDFRDDVGPAPPALVSPGTSRPRRPPRALSRAMRARCAVVSERDGRHVSTQSEPASGVSRIP